MLEMLVLGLLGDGPLTGYDLKKRIENGPGVFTQVSYGSLYPLLGRLCEKGEATVTTGTEGGRVKKHYARTARGQGRFEAWLRAPVEVRAPDSQRLVKLYFYDRLPRAERDARLAEYRQALAGYLAELDGRRARLLDSADPARHYFKLSTLYYGICVLRETLRWCDHLAQGLPLEGLLRTGGEGAVPEC